MPTYVLLSRLPSDALHDAKNRRVRGKEWIQKVKSSCPEVKFVAHYSILGAYDFMDIYEAPDAKTAHKVSMISRAEGAVGAESWQALPYDEYLKVLEDTV